VRHWGVLARHDQNSAGRPTGPGGANSDNRERGNGNLVAAKNRAGHGKIPLQFRMGIAPIYVLRRGENVFGSNTLSGFDSLSPYQPLMRETPQPVFG
jgi:hypothetical protein